MDSKIRQRSAHATAEQKKKLIELIKENRDLLLKNNVKNKQPSVCQNLWQHIADECNSIPGARKSWRQWRKMWQDLKCNARKRQNNGYTIPPDIGLTLSNSEQETLILKNVSSTTDNKEDTEFISLGEEDLDHEDYSNNSFCDPDLSSEEKVDTHQSDESEHFKVFEAKGSHSSCIYNCDKLVLQEERKLKMKEDFFNFKKDYMNKKLQLMKEQTDALKCIAERFSK